MTISLRARFWRFILRIALKNRPVPLTQPTKTSPAPANRRQPVERFSLEGLPAAWISPQGVDESKVILHLHGGGYVTGSIDSHLMMCLPMAKTLRRKILLPEYRLAPAHPFPTALEDALKAYRWLLAQGLDPRTSSSPATRRAADWRWRLRWLCAMLASLSPRPCFASLPGPT